MPKKAFSMSLPHSRIEKVEKPARLPDTAPDQESYPYWVAGLFGVAATLILAINAPIQFTFRPHASETISASLLGSALVVGGILRRSRQLFGGGSLLLLVVVSLCVWTQPAQLQQSIRTIWPLRVAIPLVLSLVWAFLLNPPSWLRHALIAVAVPTCILLLSVSQTAAIPLASGAGQGVNPNFAPNWLAIDHQGTLYAGSATGNAILVFDATGRAQGTIWPAQSPALGTPGPGIIPAGGGTIIAALNALTLPTPISNRSFHDADTDSSLFWFYGLAIDAQDRLYMVDRHISGNASLMQLDRSGNLSARWSLPSNFTAALGCLTTDTNHVYLSAGAGQVLVFDYNGAVLKTLKLPYPPAGITATGENQLVTLGQNFLNRIDVDSGATITMTLPAPDGVLQTPYQTVAVTKDGRILVGDRGRKQVLVLDPQNGQVVQTIGNPGPWPGQFAGLGGLAADAAGRIYIADDQQRVIQRFTSSGAIDAVWWAHDAAAPKAGR